MAAGTYYTGRYLGGVLGASLAGAVLGATVTAAGVTLGFGLLVMVGPGIVAVSFGLPGPLGRARVVGRPASADVRADSRRPGPASRRADIGAVRGHDAGRSWQADRSPGVTMPGARRRVDSRAATPDAAARHDGGVRSADPACKPPGSGPTPGPPTVAASPRRACRPSSPGSVSCSTVGRGLAALFLIPSLIAHRRSASCSCPAPVAGAAGRLGRLAAGPRHAADAQLAWSSPGGLLAVGQAFLDTRRAGPTGTARASSASWSSRSSWSSRTSSSTATGRSWARRSTGSSRAPSSAGRRSSGSANRPDPAATASGSTSCWSASTRRRDRTATLTDTMMVASLDPVGTHRVAGVAPARPRSTRRSGNGDALRAEAELAAGATPTASEGVPEGRACARSRMRSGRSARHPDPLLRPARLRRLHQDGRRGRRRGHRSSPREFEDPTYDGYGADGVRGFSITAGPHHLDGVERALAYARSARRVGESDFTRQARQQQILVALRDRGDPRRQPALPAPRPARRGRQDDPDRCAGRAGCPTLAAIVDEVGKDDVTSVGHPLAPGPVEEHPLRRLAGTEHGQDPRRRRRAVLRRPGPSRRRGRRRSRPRPRKATPKP